MANIVDSTANNCRCVRRQSEMEWWNAAAPEKRKGREKESLKGTVRGGWLPIAEEMCRVRVTGGRGKRLRLKYSTYQQRFPRLRVIMVFEWVSNHKASRNPLSWLVWPQKSRRWFNQWSSTINAFRKGFILGVSYQSHHPFNL